MESGKSIRSVKSVSSLKLTVPAREAKGVAPLGPVLGQYQINIVKFCKEFNEQSTKYSLGIPLMCLIKKLVSGEYRFQILRPSLYFFLSQIFFIFDKKKNINILFFESLSKGDISKENKKNHSIFLNMTDLYDVVCILSFLDNKTKKETAADLFSHLSSFVYKIKIKGC
jgi:ribosomal protein L11